MPQPEPEPVPSLTASPTRTTLHGSVLRGSAASLLAGSRALASSPRLWPVKLADLTVIVPTRNEAPNIDPLLRELRDVGPAAVLFVDDSDDQTPQVIRRRSTMQVRLMHREPGERAGGLGTAVAMGMDACTTRFCAVMDGDLQHPPAVLADLHHALAAGADLAIASRYAGRGRNAGLGGPMRRVVSRSSNTLARLAFPAELAGVSDPMSGMFAVDLSRVDVARIEPDGFKVLLELLVLARPQDVREVPYEFRPREAGDSKAGLQEGITYLRRVLELRQRSRRASAD